ENHAEAARTEFFLAGTAQSVIRLADAARISPSIRYPTPGLVVALDPDIPPSRQRIRLQADGIRAPRWRLDGKPLPNDDWAPWPGQHALALVDAGGAVLDEVRFEVRGAVIKAAQK
ncbi:MAG: penicillin-binding protein, partial [Burkholderia sp.]|nr:penicillin-binding protein [Burkholderia sp.]